MSLESCDSFRVSRFRDDIYSSTNANSGLELSEGLRKKCGNYSNGFKIFVNEHQHARMHGQGKRVNHVVSLIEHKSSHVKARMKECKKSRHRSRANEEVVSVERRNSQCALTHVKKTLGEANNE